MTKSSSSMLTLSGFKSFFRSSNSVIQTSRPLSTLFNLLFGKKKYAKILSQHLLLIQLTCFNLSHINLIKQVLVTLNQLMDTGIRTRQQFPLKNINMFRFWHSKFFGGNHFRVHYLFCCFSKTEWFEFQQATFSHPNIQILDLHWNTLFDKTCTRCSP